MASGDPLPDDVVPWTRVTTQQPSAAVDYYVATDTAFADLVASGSVTADAARDYTVKVDLRGLAPATTYYYLFRHGGRNSLTGRTRTAPAAGEPTGQLRFALASCSNHDAGYFDAYDRIAERSDLDVVLHVGDYAYEYADGVYGDPSLPNRETFPDAEITTLADPRIGDDRTALGTEQRDWLTNRLATSAAQWKHISQQVMFAPFNVGFGGGDPADRASVFATESIFLDIWDGYPVERRCLLDAMAGVDDVVVLSGDIHSSFANDVVAEPALYPLPEFDYLPFPSPSYDPATGAEAAAGFEVAVPLLAYHTATPSLELPAGRELRVSFIPVGGPLPASDSASVTLALAPGGRYVAVADGDFDANRAVDFTVEAFPAKITDLGEREVGLAFFHGTADALVVDAAFDGNAVFAAVAPGAFVDYAVLPSPPTYAHDVSSAPARNGGRRARGSSSPAAGSPTARSSSG